MDGLDKFQVLEKWLIDNGSKFPKLYLQDYGNEVRGCHTHEEIHEDEVVVDIPLKCLITVEMGKETNIGKILLINNIELDAPKHIFLMLFMLIDRHNPNSFFKPYYDILPATLHNMPIFWDKEELSYLEGSYILEQIKERDESIKDDYEAICQITGTDFSSICSLEEFKWARMCVCSRNFGLIINNVKTAALVPYADMLNHYRPRETKWSFEDASQSFHVTSLQNIPAGNQVYDSYGQKCNHRFLLNYGFSVECNVESDGSCPNEVLFEIELRKSEHTNTTGGNGNGNSGTDNLSISSSSSSSSSSSTSVLCSSGSIDLYDQKASLWKRENTTLIRRLRVSVSTLDNEATRSLFASLSIITADEDDYFRLVSFRGRGSDGSGSSGRFSSSGSSGGRNMRGSSYKSSHHASLPVSIRNEILMLKALKHTCQNMLAKYPTTLANDIKLLDEDNIQNLPLYSNKRHAIIHIRGEKEVLHFYIQLATIGIQLLQVPESNEEEYDALLEQVRLSAYARGNNSNSNNNKNDNGATESSNIDNNVSYTQYANSMIYQYCMNCVSVVRQDEFLRNQSLVQNLDLTHALVV